MKDPLPLVSICVPTYNSAGYLRESLHSILRQTYPHVEIVVSDNASTDGTLAILREYEGRQQVRVLTNEVNRGAGFNFNRLIEAARGELVAIYHSDDVYEPTIVQESVKPFLAEPEVGMVGTMGHLIDVSGIRQFTFDLPRWLKQQHKLCLNFDDLLRGIVTSCGTRTLIITPTIMVRKSVYGELGLFDEKRYKSSGDYEMWLRIGRKYAFAVIDQPLINYRVHPQQGSERELRRNLKVGDIAAVIEEYASFAVSSQVKRLCRKFIDQQVLRAALRQNRSGLFGESSGTLAQCSSNNYRGARCLLRFANACHFRIRR